MSSRVKCLGRGEAALFSLDGGRIYVHPLNVWDGETVSFHHQRRGRGRDGKLFLFSDSLCLR